MESIKMEITHEIKAEDLLQIIYSLESDALEYFGYAEDDFNELTHSMFTEYIEHLANKKETIQLFSSK